MKWEPAAAMAGVLVLGLWLVYSQGQVRVPTRPGAIVESVRIADSRGVLEALKEPDGRWSFRLLYRDGATVGPFDEDQCRAVLGARVFEHATAARGNALFKLFNITSWVSLAWIGVGLGGQLAFSGRMLLQWFLSEKHRQSVVPEAFWWMSLIGGIMLFAYFVWRQDVVGVLGQSSGLVIYARNIRLIIKKRRREARAAASAGGGPIGAGTEQTPLDDDLASPPEFPAPEPDSPVGPAGARTPTPGAGRGTAGSGSG